MHANFRRSSEIALPAIKKFVAAEKFVIGNSSPAAVPIHKIGTNFRSDYLDLVETIPVPVEVLVPYILRPQSNDLDCFLGHEIMGFLGGEAKVGISLGQFFAAFAAEAPDVRRLTYRSTKSNVGFVANNKGVLGAVFAFWCVNGWTFESRPLDFEIPWRIYNLFLAR